MAVFAVTCCQMCHAAGEKTASFQVYKNAEQRGENPCNEKWKFTVWHFKQVLLKLLSAQV